MLWNVRWTRRVLSSRISSATHSAATSRFSSQREVERQPSWRSRRPADGAPGDLSYEDLLRAQRELQTQVKAAAPHATTFLATPQGRHRATELITTHFEHIPADLLAHQMLGIATCQAAVSLIENALSEGWTLDAERITCPVRIVWGTADKLLPWPQASARYRKALPRADWVLLDGIGHCPQLDVPVEAAQLILGFTCGRTGSTAR